MENQTPQSNPTSPSPRWPIILISGVLFVILLGGAIYYTSTTKQSFQERLSEQNPMLPIEDFKSKAGWVKPKSTQRAYPVVGNGQTLSNDPTGRLGYPLSIYLIDSKSLKKTNTLVDADTGAAGIGGSAPKVSPNLFYTAFIDRKGQFLRLLSHETLQQKTIAEHADFITGWTPDSKKIIYYISENTVTTHTQGPALLNTTKISFPIYGDPGFYVFDITNGKTTKLYPVENIQGIINNKLLLVKVEENQQQYYKTPIVFNTETFEADYGYIKEEFHFGDGSFSFSSDGKWTFLHSSDPKNPTADSNVVVSLFPNKQGETIDSGKWADFQFPKLSPGGITVAYAKIDGYLQPGQPRYSVWTYNTITKQKTNHAVEGFAEFWVDEDTLVISASDASKHENYLYLLDLSTGSTTKIY